MVSKKKRPAPVEESISSSADSSSECYSSDESQPQELPSRTPGTIPPVPRTSHVPQKLKEKIVNGEYFEIKKLLPSLDDDNEPEERLSYSEWERMEYSKRSREKERSERKLTYFRWTRCFRTLMSLRLKSFPHELQGMLRHAEIAQDLHQRGKDAIEYDAEFRRAKEQHPSIQWGEFLAEIVVGLQEPQHKPAMSNIKASSKAQGICRRFNTTENCKFANCKYAHKCSSCFTMGHPQYRCFKKPLTAKRT